MILNQIIAHGRALSANEVMYSVLKCFEKRILLEDAAVNTKQNSNKHVFSTNDFLYVGESCFTFLELYAVRADPHRYAGGIKGV